MQRGGRSEMSQEAKLREALRWALEWIDAVPQDTQLPAMPGFDRDYVNGLIASPVQVQARQPVSDGTGLMKCGVCGDGQLYCNSCGTGQAILAQQAKKGGAA